MPEFYQASSAQKLGWHNILVTGERGVRLLQLSAVLLE